MATSPGPLAKISTPDERRGERLHGEASCNPSPGSLATSFGGFGSAPKAAGGVEGGLAGPQKQLGVDRKAGHPELKPITVSLRAAGKRGWGPKTGRDNR